MLGFASPRHWYIILVMPDIKSPKNAKELPQAVVAQMTTLATSGLGLVAALAWNNVIQEVVNAYIKPYIGEGSGIISLLIYAVAITGLAVFVVLWLTKIQETVENIAGTKKDKAKKKK